MTDSRKKERKVLVSGSGKSRAKMGGGADGGGGLSAGDELRQLFAKGSLVEVGGFDGPRYAATVLNAPWTSGPLGSPASPKRNNPNSNDFFVEYLSLFDIDGFTPLRRYVEIHRVRPFPPPPPSSDPVTSFDLYDVVESFYRDGWWTGVIIGVISRSRFIVALRNSPEEIECGLPNLRVHQDWVGGKWVLHCKKERNISQLISGLNLPKKRGRLSKSLEQILNASVAGVSPNGMVQQCTETSESQKEIPMHADARDGNVKVGSDANRDVPFAKASPLWKAIESMEVFQVMPQKPHFCPLNGCKEGSREGLAIGCMVTFSSVVKKISELQFDDPRSTIEDLLETLLDLEAHGFDVKMVRDRLTCLLLIKDRQEYLHDQSKELESQIMERSSEKTNPEEIDEIDKQIRELHEKLVSAISTKEIKDAQIACLQSDGNTINKGIKSTQVDFEELAAAPL